MYTTNPTPGAEPREDAGAPEPNKPKTPQQFMASLPGAPTADQIAALKAEVPNGVIRGFSPDGKRLFLMRAITGLEMRELQKNVIPNASDPEGEFKILAVCAACVWTNAFRSGKIEQASLRAATAGLPDTLFSIVEELSDYFPPVQIAQMSFEL
jgi:hypothetical protein